MKKNKKQNESILKYILASAAAVGSISFLASPVQAADHTVTSATELQNANNYSANSTTYVANDITLTGDLPQIYSKANVYIQSSGNNVYTINGAGRNRCG